MVCCHPNVGDSGFEHAGYAVEHATCRRNFLVSIVGMGREGVEVTEQFVCAVHEVDVHVRTSSTSSEGGYR